MAEEENSIEQEEELPIEDPNPVVPDEEVEDAEASEELVEEDEEGCEIPGRQATCGVGFCVAG